MDYAVSDIAELFDEIELDVYKIRKIGKIWGAYEGDSWIGGICFRSRSGEYYRVSRVDVGAEITIEEAETPFSPLSQDYEDSPTDLIEWIRDGGLLEDSYRY